MNEYVVSVDTATANIDCHISHSPDPPVVVVLHQHWLGVGHHHLGLHLLAGVELGPPALVPPRGTQYLSDSL